MDPPANGSVTCWLDRLREGNESAAQDLWDRYFTRLVTLARGKLYGCRRESDEEDIALSALKSAIVGVQENRFPNLRDRTGLWPLLVMITARKAINEMRRQNSQKRRRGAEATSLDVDAIVRYDPTPQFAMQLVEEIDGLVDALGDDTLRSIVGFKLEGYTNDEIALKLDVSTRTIVRKLNRIRQEWEEGSRNRALAGE